MTEFYLSPVAEKILKLRYLKRDEEGTIIETPFQMFQRVADNIAKADMKYSENLYKKNKNQFLEALTNLEFVPASPILMNAGNDLQQLFSDFVFVLRDELKNIFGKLKTAAVIQQNGSGCGYSFSKIRPKHDSVGGMKDVAFGPVTVMKIFDIAIGSIKQGGKRPGGNMAALHVNHPDILEFIHAKSDGSLSNFNISVAVTNSFIESVKQRENYELLNPKNKEIHRKLNAYDVFQKMVESSWRCGDPGILFIDEINDKHTIKEEVLSTGSCGQSPLHSWEGIPYGHINLSKIVKSGRLDLEKLRRLVHLGVHFLDNCIDMNRYQFVKSETICKENRRIGLGVLGFADMLIRLKIPYDSDKALKTIEKIMAIVKEESRKYSGKLAKERGVFENYDKSTWKDQGIKLRNASLTAIAPTGSTSLIANTTSGIEPIYSIAYTTTMTGGDEFTYINSEFEKVAKRLNLSKETLRQIAASGNLKEIDLQEDLKKLFVTSMQVNYKWHLKIQAKFQEYIDAAISKTINMPEDATFKDVEKVFFMAHELGCKGITIYRDASKSGQVITAKKEQTKLDSF